MWMSSHRIQSGGVSDPSETTAPCNEHDASQWKSADFHSDKDVETLPDAIQRLIDDRDVRVFETMDNFRRYDPTPQPSSLISSGLASGARFNCELGRPHCYDGRMLADGGGPLKKDDTRTKETQPRKRLVRQSPLFHLTLPQKPHLCTQRRILPHNVGSCHLKRIPQPYLRISRSSTPLPLGFSSDQLDPAAGDFLLISLLTACLALKFAWPHRFVSRKKGFKKSPNRRTPPSAVEDVGMSAKDARRNDEDERMREDSVKGVPTRLGQVIARYFSQPDIHVCVIRWSLCETEQPLMHDSAHSGSLCGIRVSHHLSHHLWTKPRIGINGDPLNYDRVALMTTKSTQLPDLKADEATDLPHTETQEVTTQPQPWGTSGSHSLSQAIPGFALQGQQPMSLRPSPFNAYPQGFTDRTDQAMIWNAPPTILMNESPHLPLFHHQSFPSTMSGPANTHTVQYPFFHGGTFPGAHNFTIGTAIMNDHGQLEEEKILEKGLNMLLAKAMPDAMLHSEARSYPPRCNEDTRKTMRDGLLEWGLRDRAAQALLWLSGPAAVGKSAVAQTVAEAMKEEGRLGGVFFFSRPNNRSNPNVVIPTLVYQLILILPPYKLIIAQRLHEDPTILSQDRRSQFREFFTIPFITALAVRPLTRLNAELLDLLSRQPLLLVLDGLDECNDHNAQCELIQLIGRYVIEDGDSRLRWMVCSRPESHLKVVFSSSGLAGAVLRKKLQVDNKEAQADALRIIQKGFSDIRNRYPDHVDAGWPQESQVRFIAEQASGHLGFASFIIRFIGDEKYDDPSGQLDVCIDFLQRMGSSGFGPNPLHALDLLYSRILSDVQKNLLHYTDSILGMLVLYGQEKLSALTLANFLGLKKATFYGSLQRLHSVLMIPNPNEAHDNSIKVYHASFFDFLKDSARSGEFAVDEASIHFDIASSSFEWLRYYCKNPSEQELVDLSWASTLINRQKLLGSICDFAFGACWKSFAQIPHDSRVTLIPTLKTYDFDILDSKWQEASEGQRRDFAYFVQWLLTTDTGIPVRIDCWHSNHLPKRGESESQQTIISWYEKDPSAFIQAIIKDAGYAPEYSILLRIMSHSKPARFCLHLSHFLEDRKDDTILLLMGSRNSGKNQSALSIVGNVMKANGTPAYPSELCLYQEYKANGYKFIAETQAGRALVAVVRVTGDLDKTKELRLPISDDNDLLEGLTSALAELAEDDELFKLLEEEFREIPGPAGKITDPFERW
ncbi:hypothetical protein NP233_g1970 [Leucocoprinus birnbaumii]|uniref:Nephrocystin 3-like N-terminal domain-containing protein n=1 Tax=Leucocoprinus birnbaumii TaxID=56174 RepID=A0AAD5W525_9AGAR|nr:hypothetical protein NP233_g1970 [Leucocoprinus birnbaumii]